MLKIQGKIRAIKTAVNGNGGIGRQMTIDFAGDAVLDEIAEIMREGSILNVTIEPQQLKIGDKVPAMGGKR